MIPERNRNGIIYYKPGHSSRGLTRSPETRAKVGKASHKRNQGINNPFYGKHHSPETLKKLQGEIRYNWKGDDVSVESLHQWIHKRKPKPALCVICYQRAPYDLANVSSKYNPETYNRDLSNWFWACRKCHMELDGRIPL